MKTINIELLGNVNVYFGMGLQIVTAILLGGLIGMEREAKLKSAGIKTNILICLGSTLYTSISFMGVVSGVPYDPNRVSAQIVSGIGFLGAGAIIQSRGNVTGLTSAATIWVVASVGIAIGKGYPLIATLFTLTVLAVLRALGPLYRLLKLDSTYHIQLKSREPLKFEVTALLKQEGLSSSHFSQQIVKEGEDQIFLVNFELSTSPQVVKSFVRELRQFKSVINVSSHVQIENK
jgi:putative Mg2+ transporter-C (MgtC) family protein